MPRNASEVTAKIAQEARKSSSVAEAITWKLLRGRQTGFKFRREQPIGPYRIDFFCAEASLAVETDGEPHEPDRGAMRLAYLDPASSL